MASREELLAVLVSLRDLQRSLSALTSRVVALVGDWVPVEYIELCVFQNIL